MPEFQSPDSNESVPPMQEPTTPTIRDSMPQIPTTPPRLITATLDSPMSSTMSSPEIVHETLQRNVFDESGTIHDLRQRKAESQSVDEDEDEGVDLSDTDGRSERDQVDHESLDETNAEPNDPAQTQGIDSRADVAKAKSTAQLYDKYELDDVLKTQDLDGTNSTQRLQRSRASSTPPEPRSSKEPQMFGRKSKFVHRFNQEHLPPPTLPLHMEILAYIQRWGPWVAQIADYDTRMSLIHHITVKMREVWSDGIKKGLIPKKAPEGQATMSPEKLQAAMEEQRGREAEQKKQKQKRQVSPSKAVVIEIKRKIHTDKVLRSISITAGELHEAGVKWQNVLDRVSTGRLDPERVLIDKTVERLGRNILTPKDDWEKKVKPTKNNIIGRDLLMYCLWEVFRCDIQLEYLKNMLDMAQTDRETLETEQKLRDQLMAVALELDSDDEDESSSDEEGDDTPQPFGSSKDKRSIETSPGPPAKRTKLETLTALKATPEPSEPEIGGSPGSQELLPVLPLEITNLDVFRKQVEFIRSEIQPKANALLEAAGEELETLDESGGRWAPISTRLQESGVAWNRINELILEINARFSNIKAEDKRAKEQQEVIRDVEGLPSRLEIWHTIPPEGFTNPELQEAFPEVTASNPTWQKLVKSVARYEKKANRWLPQNHFPDYEAQPSQREAGSRPSLKVALKLKSLQSWYEPEDFSPEKVHQVKGFKWRYMNSSTIQQRMSMEDVVKEYVDKHIAFDSPKKRVKRVPHVHRRGTYIVLGHPDYPDAPGVAHGIWDIRKDTDTENPNLIWFYDGGDREVVDLGFASYEPVPQGTEEEMENLYQSREMAQIQQEQQAKAGEIPEQKALSQAPVVELTSKSSPAEIPDDTSKNNKTPKAGRGGRGSRGGGRGGKRGARGGGRGSKAKGTKRKIVEDSSSDDDLPRPRRKAARVVAYNDGDGGDEGDEYVPEDEE